MEIIEEKITAHEMGMCYGFVEFGAFSLLRVYLNC